MKKNRKRYDLYEVVDESHSEFCYGYKSRDRAILCLGMLLGEGRYGYIEEVTFEEVEHTKRMNI